MIDQLQVLFNYEAQTIVISDINYHIGVASFQDERIYCGKHET